MTSPLALVARPCNLQLQCESDNEGEVEVLTRKRVSGILVFIYFIDLLYEVVVQLAVDEAIK